MKNSLLADPELFAISEKHFKAFAEAFLEESSARRWPEQITNNGRRK